MRFSDKNVWQRIKLNEYADFLQGLTYTPNNVSTTGRLVLRSSNIQNSKLVFDDNVYVNMNIPAKISTKENDVLMCVRNGSKNLVGKTALITKEFENLAWGAFMNIIRPKDGKTLLFHFLNSQYFKNQIKADLNTATVNQITIGTLNQCKISIPLSEIEKDKLCILFNLLDQRIDAQSKIIEDLELFEKEINNTIINKLVEYKDLVKFSSIYNFAKEGGTPNTSHPEYYTKGSIPFVKIDDLTTKYLVCNQSFITKLGLENSSAWLIPANSILYSNGATIGAISINKYPVTTKQGILGIVPKSDYLSEYLYYFLRSNYFKKEICKITTQGTMKSAYIKDIDNILVPRINKNQQNEILTLLSEITLKIQQEKDILELYKKQKAYLLKNMFI